ncbi:hypothetical protein [Sphaerotilus sp.]|uniref:hypothetical protein n=1 Tax=Sphaerotilus sp. TaxID=2093942 RepID=UPI0025E27702|nr:hypothetical protein [Sphaerotilus sp.]
MQVESTSDISVNALRQSAGLLPPEWQAQVSDEQFFMRAMEVPSWITIAAGAPWWVQFLGGAATVYVTGIISEAGKDTWKNRGELTRIGASAISRLSTFIIESIAQSTPKTFAVLAIPLGNGFDKVQLKLDATTQEELDFQIAIFVHNVSAIQSLIEQEGLSGNRAVGGVFLEFGANDYSLLASWLDRETLERKTQVLSPEAITGV